MKKTVLFVILAGLLLLSACGGGAAAPEQPAPARRGIVSDAQPDPAPPVETARPKAPAAELMRPPAPTAEPAPTPAPTPIPTPEPTPVPLVPGTYKGADGSVLKVKSDGFCTFETLVSGKINGSPMSGRLTFHGTVENGAFSFARVTYFGLDLTSAAKDAGIESAEPWEQAAAAIYLDGID